MTAISPVTLLELYESMVTMKLWDQTALRLLQEGRVLAGYHTGRGQEAIPAGGVAPLRRDDYLMYAHRGFGYTIAKGMSLAAMFGDLMANTAGATGGLGAGIPHFADPELGILGQGGTLGSCFGIATGAAFSAKYRGTDQVVVCFFGDGTANRGAFHESVNAAAAWKLPVVWICENNGYAVSVPVAESTAGRIVDRAVGYGMPGVRIDGMDVTEVYRATCEAVDRARAGEGPTLIEAMCHRFRGHYEGDPQVYRTEEETGRLSALDPITNLAARLVADGIATEERLGELEVGVQDTIDRAVEEASSAPMPGPERIYEGLYV
ncbi:MAG: thiamine pyrophosphate-dependent dehydrogenase E1 component subunit alpha [Acidimicrobiia bacterium]|nr:thiamine pyrophosphate-dependent dehydrogenase E1 component subunit alpha [Acidimicrobiia bacterium]